MVKTIISNFKKRDIVGLDIGSSSIKMVRLARSQDGLCLVKAALQEIRYDDDNARMEENTVSALKSITKGINLRGCKVMVGVNCPRTAIKVAKVPYMPKADLEQGISLEAKNYFPFSIKGSAIGYEVIEDIVEKGVRKYEVAVAASPEMTIARNLSLLGKAGIKPDSLVPCTFLLQKIGEHLYSKGDETVCFIDIGKIYTEMIIFKGKSLKFARKIPASGDDFTKAMTGVLISDRGRTELSLAEAEKIKREVGIPPEGASELIDNKIAAKEILSMLRAPLEHLAKEAERGFDYYREETGSTGIDSVVLFGGGASLHGLVEFLSRELNVPVKLGDIPDDITVEDGAISEGALGKISYRLEMALGAALSRKRGINLLPPEVKEAAKRLFTRATIQAAATGVIFASALLYIGMNIQLDNFEKRISVAKLELSSLEPQFQKAEAHHLANIVLVDEPHWEDIFRELSNIIPGDICLTDMDMTGGVVTIKGLISAENAEECLSDFILALEKGIFKDVKLVKVKSLGGEAGSGFTLTCHTE